MTTSRAVGFFLSYMLLCIAACRVDRPVMQVEAISMTRRHIAKGATFGKKKPVKGRHCPSGSSGGLIDEVVKAAQKEYKVDVIFEAEFKMDGDCILLKGQGARLR